MAFRFLASSIQNRVGQACRSKFLNNNSLSKISYQKCYHYRAALVSAPNQFILSQRATFNPSSVIINGTQCRNIYDMTDEIESNPLATLRKKRRPIFGDNWEDYISRLSEYVEDDSSKLIREDVMNLAALAQNSDHLDLLDRLVVKMRDQNSSAWGTLLMRLYCDSYELDRALNNYMDDEKFGEVFKQSTTAKLLLNSLFVAGRYEDVITAYHRAMDLLKDRFEGQHPRQLKVIAMAAWAKICTMEAFEAAKAEYNYNEVMTKISRRIDCFMAYMAIELDEPANAFNYVDKRGYNLPDNIERQIDWLPQDLKSLALFKLGRYYDLQQHLQNISVRGVRDSILKSTFSTISESLKDKVEDAQIQQALRDTLMEIEKKGLINNSDLESKLFSPLTNSHQRRFERGSMFQRYKPERNEGPRMSSDRFNSVGRNS